MTVLQMIISHALHGLVYGMLLFLVSVGLTVVFGMMNVLSIAHAAFYMLGAYFAISLTGWFGSFWTSLVLAPIGVGIIGYCVERFLLSKIHYYGHGYELMLTFGVFYVIQESVKLVWGDYPRAFPIPKDLSGAIEIIGLEIPFYHLFIIIIGIVVLSILAYFFLKTRIGITVRSIVSDAQMVSILGVNTERVFIYVFAVSSVLAGLGGVIAGPFLSTYSAMGLDMMIDMFIVVVVGGFGSLMGAFVASLLIGELQSFGVLIIPKLALVMQFLLMAAVLVIKPTGLFGEKV